MDVEAQEDGIMGKIIVCRAVNSARRTSDTHILSNKLPDGSKSIPVGKIIAMLAEEGDDISNITVPEAEASTPAPKKEEAAAPPPTSSSPPPSTSSSSSPASATHDSGESIKEINGQPLFPSVVRLLHEAGIHSKSEIKKIKGTGVRGMIRKGDVLAHLGKVSNPWGTSKGLTIAKESPASAPAAKNEEKKVSTPS